MIVDIIVVISLAIAIVVLVVVAIFRRSSSFVVVGRYLGRNIVFQFLWPLKHGLDSWLFASPLGVLPSDSYCLDHPSDVIILCLS